MKSPGQWYYIWSRDVTEMTLTQLFSRIQSEAYNQCLEDLAKDDLIVDKERTLKKYKKK